MRKLKKKGVVFIYITFLVLAVILVVMTAVVAPLGTRITSQMYAAGEDLIIMSNETIQSIDDPDVRGAINNGTAQALDSVEFNITLTQQIFIYSGVIILLLAGLIFFVATRRTIEFGGGRVS